MTEKELLESIRSNKPAREKAIRWLFQHQELRGGIAKVLHSKDETLINDIFNLTLVQFMKKIMRNKEFKFKSNFKSYIYGIARNLYYQKLRKAPKEYSGLENYELADQEENSIDLVIIDDEKKKIIQELLDDLGKNCREVLNEWAEGSSMKRIAQLMEYKSSGYARKKKHLCMKELIEKVSGNPYLKSQLLG